MGRATVACPSPLDVAAEAFRVLCQSPAAPDLDVSGFASDLPARVIRLDELQRLLLAGATQATREVVWTKVILRARRDETWLLAAAGMALPALRNVAGGLARGFDGDVEELDAEVLAGFLAHVAVVDVALPGIVTKLRWAAYRAGRAFVVAHRRAAEREEEISEKTAGLSRPSGHPDLVLMRAGGGGSHLGIRCRVDLCNAARWHRHGGLRRAARRPVQHGEDPPPARRGTAGRLRHRYPAPACPRGTSPCHPSWSTACTEPID